MSLRRQTAGAAWPWLLAVFLVAALPLAGILAAGMDPAPYLEMPPMTRHVPHAGFSWSWFVSFAIIDLLLAIGLGAAVFCGWVGIRKARPQPPSHAVFPWWGWIGLAMCLIFWWLAWQRVAWFRIFQRHTFQPLWIGFILSINAVTVKRSGGCLLLRRPLGFLLLFPVSTAFWWAFEYLNRFVQNWYYTGVECMGPAEYTVYSSLAFATVLPAVISVSDLLLTIPALGSGLARCRPLRLPASSWIPAIGLAVSATGLTLIGIFPDQLFALLWVSPLFIFLSIQLLTGQPTLLHHLLHGDWRPLVIPALAALVCGFFWELWNYHSLARWTYAIAFVQRFHLFEMPIVGYGGYLPFGLECLVIGAMVIGDPFDSADRNASTGAEIKP